MKNFFYASLLCVGGFAQAADNTYHYSFDLTKIASDQLQVSLTPPALTENEIVFSFPKMVPGTYSIYDFGRFVEDLKAFDSKGLPLSILRMDTNSWKISNATSLAKITYRVNDTYDEEARGNPIFEPAGTNFQRDTNFVLNLHTLLGYFRNHTKQPFEISIGHSENLYGSTSLIDNDNQAARDMYTAANYNDVVDNPIMYSAPDTAHITVGKTDVLIALYSPSHKPNAKGIAKQLDTLLQAAGKYLGGQLPVEKYSFLIYLNDQPGIGGGFGALEHSYCSMYYLIDGTNEMLGPILRDVAAHEFFHIVTPLNIHSYEIEDFDFDHPKMSEHLWLYEGSTEFHAHAMQVKQHLITPLNYLSVLKSKLDEAQFNFNDSLPFTEMSKGCLDTFKEQYNNVYAKGALISTCLDLELLKLSKGKYGLMNLIQDLAKKYGKSKAFRDAELFPKIVLLTYPEIKTFFEMYVSGTAQLPMERVLSYAGVKFEKETASKGFSMGQFEVAYNTQTKHLLVGGLKNVNDFGKKMGYRVGDELLKFNGKRISPAGLQEMREKWLNEVKVGDKLTLLVLRQEANGKKKKLKLTTTVFKANIKRFNTLSFEEKLTPEQEVVKKAWLGL